MWSTPRVLLVRFGSLGDVVLATCLPEAVRRRYPNARITFVTRRRYADLVETNPAVDRVLGVEQGESIAALAHRMSAEPFDIGLDLQRSLRSRRLRKSLPGRWALADTARAERLRLIWLGRAPRRSLALTHRYAAAARALGIEPGDGRPRIRLTAADRDHAARIASAGCVALAPGAAWASKRWPAQRWRELAGRLLETGHQVVAVGSAEEQTLIEVPGVIPAFGLPLRVTAAILERARVLVAHDSGLLHLGVAVGTPAVALFGPTVRALGFVAESAPVRVIERAVACRPCSPFGSAACPLGHHRCLRGIPVEPVAAAVQEVAP
jgi:heptosyltransferase-2